MIGQLSLFETGFTKGEPTKVVNVVSVPMRSPFRYPGGKTWLIPSVRKWLAREPTVKQLIEPYAGGGIVKTGRTERGYFPVGMQKHYMTGSIKLFQ